MDTEVVLQSQSGSTESSMQWGQWKSIVVSVLFSDAAQFFFPVFDGTLFSKLVKTS